MGIGPFTTYAPPGVYTSTLVEPAVGQLLGGLRIPVLIGTGQESMSQDNYEIVRGSSSVSDTPIFGEDVAARWVVSGTNTNPVLGNQTGDLFKFRVRNYPIVDGTGIGRTAFDANRVAVSVNGQPVSVSGVDGTNGIVSLLIAPEPTDIVTVNYYFHRKDTRITDDVSIQVTLGSAVLIVPRVETYVIVTGVNDTLIVNVNDSASSSTIVFPAATYTAASAANAINIAAIPGLTASVHVDNQALNHVQLVAQGNVLIGSGNANGTFGLNPGAYTNRNRSFRVFNGPIVDGSDGGITTTDPSKVVVMVNGTQVLASAVDGANRLVTLSSAPFNAAIVTIQYYFNTYQDTFDYLPNSNIVSTGNVGISPGRRDYLNGPDFIVINQGDQSIIQWGTAFQVQPGTRTGTTFFDGTQVLGLLVDDRIFAIECARFTNPTTNSIETNVWTLPLQPTTGNGRDTPLSTSVFNAITNGRIDLPTDQPELVTAYVGKTVRDALGRPPVTVLAVDSVTNNITLKDPVPADYRVYATFWYNRIQDDTYTLTVINAGSTGVGTYNVASQAQGRNLLSMRFGTKTALPQSVNFPSGSELNPDAIQFGGNPVSETATITFTLQPATHASFTNANAEPYDLFAPGSNIFGSVIIDGVPISVNMSTAYPATLAGQPVFTPATLVFAATDRLVLEVDGVSLSPIDVSALTTLSAVANSVNEQTVIDLANELKADYNSHIASTTYHLAADVANPVTSPDATSLASAITLINEMQGDYNAHRVSVVFHPNADIINVSAAAAAVDLPTAVTLANELKTVFNSHRVQFNTTNGNVHVIDDTVNVVSTPNSGGVATVITYGTEQVLGLQSTKTPAAAPSGLNDLSRTKVLIPVLSGQTDAASKIGLQSNLEATGSYNSINQPGFQVSGNAGPFNISASVTDQFRFNIDGTDFTSILPSGSTTSTTAVANAINGTIASAADIATATATLVTLANDIKTQFNLHIPSVVFHTIADVVNTITSPAATDLPTSITLLNEARLRHNAHRVTGAFHPAPDTINAVLASNATNLGTAITLANEIKAEFNRHRLQTIGAVNVHVADDAVNVVAAVDVLFANPAAFAGTLTGQYAGKLLLRSFVNTVQSVVTTQDGTANSVLGFSSFVDAFRDQPTASDIASALDANTTFFGAVPVLPAVLRTSSKSIAWAISVAGLGMFLQINSDTAGSTSTISFASVANTAFIPDTGIGITPGISGDTGEATHSGFTVTSSDLINGSSGTGFPGQTYTDARTGLRFTILPATSGDYAIGGSFTLLIGSTFTCDASIPTRQVPGIETTVLNTNGMAAGTTAFLSTYLRTGNEPRNGDVYYISYQFAKTDISTALFRDLKRIQQNFGPPTPEFPLSLAARLALLNGAVLVGIRQVLRAPNSSQASLQSYVEAIDDQQKPIAGNIKPDVITPLTSDPQVFAYLNQHCAFMGSPRQEGERIGVVGVAVGTNPLGVQAIAKGLASELMIVVYPDSYVVTITDTASGGNLDLLIDGTYCAAALAGTACAPSIDVATPWTRRQIQGLKRVGRILDPTDANQTAVAGVTVIEQVESGLRVRHGLTTNLASVITRTPSVILTIQYVQQTTRKVLDPFIGQKFNGQILKSIESAMVGAFSTLIDNQIVAKVSGISATVDDQDPTIARTEAIYVPVFPLEYIVSILSIRIRL